MSSGAQWLRHRGHMATEDGATMAQGRDVVGSGRRALMVIMWELDMLELEHKGVGLDFRSMERSHSVPFSIFSGCHLLGNQLQFTRSYNIQQSSTKSSTNPIKHEPHIQNTKTPAQSELPRSAPWPHDVRRCPWVPIKASHCPFTRSWPRTTGSRASRGRSFDNGRGIDHSDNA